MSSRRETWAVSGAVVATLTLLVVATWAVGRYVEARMPVELHAENGRVLTWAESDSAADVEAVAALEGGAWKSFDELETPANGGDGVWVKAVLPAVDHGEGSTVALPTTGFWQVDAYVRTGAGWLRMKSGEQVRWLDRPVLSQEVAFVIPRLPGEETTVYLRMLARDFVDGWLFYWPRAEAGRQYLMVPVQLYGLYFGGWAVLLGYNLLLALVLRRKAIWLYVAYSFCFGVMLFISNELDGIFSPWQSSHNRFRVIIALIIGQTGLLIWFARALLGIGRGQTGHRVMHVAGTLLGVASGSVVLWTVGWMAGGTMYWIMTGAVMGSMVLMLCVAGWRWWRGQAIAGWFMLTFVPVVLAFIWMWICAELPAAPEHLTLVPFLLGSAAELVLLSVVLAYHYRQIEQENVRMKTALAEGLEKEVAQRTQELREMTEELSASNRFKDRIFAVLGHDLRSPVATTIQFTEVLAREPELFQPNELAQQAEWLHRSNSELLEMVDDLLGWARAESGELKVMPVPIKVTDLVSSPLAILSGAARKKSIELATDIPESLIACVDKKTMQTVVRNLVSNSIKFTPAGGRVEIGARADGEQARLWARDSGVGMTPEQIERLNLGLGGASTTGTAQEKGTGFGWVLCGQFLRLNCVSWSIESAPGEGTAVNLLLPLAPIEERADGKYQDSGHLDDIATR